MRKEITKQRAVAERTYQKKARKEDDAAHEGIEDIFEAGIEEQELNKARRIGTLA